MIGKTLNHFKVLDHLGKGGMGEVYVAEDTKLKRRVALKLLSEDVSRDPARLDRFQREAESIAALNHPNIVTIHSIEEAGGVRFLTMELVEGETLTQMIPSNGMDFESFLRFSAPVAEALCAAHEKGIIHRDLKPGNIMVTHEGRVKVLDFGLAKLIQDDSDPDTSRAETRAHTEAGIVLGTMPYMSPEQVQGKRLDQRSDIFSLGIVFYEMITGRRPFHGDTSAELISSILRDTPEAVSDLKPEMPEHLERVIRRCLMKDPRDRYQTARDVYNELRDLSAVNGSSSRSRTAAVETKSSARRFVWPAAFAVVALVIALAVFWQKRQSPTSDATSIKSYAPAKSIAVLPFVNESGNPDDEYFSDGITDELASAFMKVPGLRVAARSSAFMFKGKGTDAREVGAKLNVSTVLEGTVRRSASKIRVTVQLVNAADGLAVWSERYERETKDVFAVQDDITNAIVSALHLRLASGPSAVNSTHTANAEAHDLYLRGRFLMLKQNEESLTKSLDYFGQALAKDPNYASPYAGMSFAWAYLADAALPPKEAYPKAKDAALKALELDPTNAEARTMFAVIQWLYDWDLSAAKQEFHRALQSNPSSVDAHNFYGTLLCASKQFDAGLAEIQRAITLDPLNAWPSWMREYCLSMARRYDDVIEQAKITRELDPNLYYLDSWLGMAYREKGMYDESITEYLRVHKLTGKPIPGLGITYARRGKTAEAQNVLQELLDLAKHSYVTPENIAMIYVALGEKEQAFAWLDKSYEVKTGALPVISISPVFDPIRSDPRFPALLKKMGIDKQLL